MSEPETTGTTEPEYIIVQPGLGGVAWLGEIIAGEPSPIGKVSDLVNRAELAAAQAEIERLNESIENLRHVGATQHKAVNDMAGLAHIAQDEVAALKTAGDDYVGLQRHLKIIGQRDDWAARAGRAEDKAARLQRFCDWWKYEARKKREQCATANRTIAEQAATIEAVRELHRREPYDSMKHGMTFEQTDFSDRCSVPFCGPYPCATIRALPPKEGE